MWHPAMRRELIEALPKLARPESDPPIDAKSYVVVIKGHRVGVWLSKRCFYVYNARALRVPVSAPNGLNKLGNLQIGWRDSISKAWATALETLGVDADGADVT